jgi:hypothetical protein
MMRNTTIPVTIGCQTPTGETNHWKGKLDELRIWSVARTAQQIADNYRAELTSGTGLVARWGCNDGSGITLVDSVAARNATITGSPANSHLFRPYDGCDVYLYGRATSGGAVSQLGGEVQLNWKGM